ncbi:MAG: hypothetical protein LIO58_05630 [Oscillospiraceae bacterium]|nr:hypothetical protein [Oscillospiraceae bacterium]
MNSRSQRATNGLTIRELTLFAVSAAIMEALKVAMAALPNIEPVTLLIIIFVGVYGRRAIFPVLVYIFLEGILFGFGIWWVSYLYIWPLLVAVSLLLVRCRSPLVWAMVAGLFGLLFGALCAIPYFVTGGAQAAFAYWVAGLYFDLLHGASNFVLVLLLYKPLSNLCTKLVQRMSL